VETIGTGSAPPCFDSVGQGCDQMVGAQEPEGTCHSTRQDAELTALNDLPCSGRGVSMRNTVVASQARLRGREVREA
jgi:hypothetical protein